MKRHLLILTISLLWTSLSLGQTINKTDSLEIMAKVDTVFSLFKNPDFNAFKELSSEKIYCIICFDKSDFSDNPYMLYREVFFNKYLKDINNSDVFYRAKKSQEIILIQENDHRSDITILFTVYKKNELAPGHQGGQLGMYFKKIGGEFKFAGIETLP